jgi:hypothetical protein
MQPKMNTKYLIICFASTIGLSLLQLPRSEAADLLCVNEKLEKDEICRIVDGQKIIRSLLTPLPGSEDKKTDCEKICEILKLK